jgi:hypothetical protein
LRHLQENSSHKAGLDSTRKVLVGRSQNDRIAPMDFSQGFSSRLREILGNLGSLGQRGMVGIKTNPRWVSNQCDWEFIIPRAFWSFFEFEQNSQIWTIISLSVVTTCQCGLAKCIGLNNHKETRENFGFGQKFPKSE